ncbi:MAG TPA: hypothetical protein VFK30_14190, partial [Anaerolineae bacterium]|nr:hypothetical protein [Anaerolineae bacterium]
RQAGIISDVEIVPGMAGKNVRNLFLLCQCTALQADAEGFMQMQHIHPGGRAIGLRIEAGPGEELRGAHGYRERTPYVFLIILMLQITKREDMRVFAASEQLGVMFGHERADAVDHGRIAVSKLPKAKGRHSAA